MQGPPSIFGTLANDSAISCRTDRPEELSPLLRVEAKSGTVDLANCQHELCVLNWAPYVEETVMLQTVPRLLPELLLILMTAVATHLVMSFAQTLMHYKLGHHPIGGKFFRNHINFHHTYYSKDHLVSPAYLGDEGNNTPFFFIPVFLVGACTYLLLPVDLFVIQVVACAMSFYAHVFFDKEYHVEGSRLQRFAWFRRKQELHFVHHRHANCNFAVIHFFWDRILGTYRRPDATVLPARLP
jgi:sterol desaturase/sphingolipid hydroxylase (fatty acid hydroxylase superfamily)